MRNTVIALSLASAAALPPVASAQTAAPAGALPERTFTGNIALVTDYRFRGISQSWREPALQAGVDYGHPSGWYAGLWSSQISGNVYPGAWFEVDLYGGYKGSLSNGIGYSAGLIQYKYPGGRYRPAAGIAPQRFDTLEANFDVSYRSFGLKYSHALSDYFGVNSTSAASPSFCSDSSPASPCAPGVARLPARGSSRGSSYLDLNGNVELGEGVTLGLHAGRQVVRNYDALGFRDYRVSLGKELAGYTLTLAYTNTTADRGLYNYADNAGTTFRQLAGAAWVVSVGRSF